MTPLDLSLPAQLLIRPTDGSTADWQVLDSGPGLIAIPEGSEVQVRIKGIDDRALAVLVKELEGLRGLVFLNLAENRNVTDKGVGALKGLPQLSELNLSSCSLTTLALEHLNALSGLTRLDISYCNRLTDASLRPLHSMRQLEYLNLRGCVKITNGGIARLKRRGLEIFR